MGVSHQSRDWLEDHLHNDLKCIERGLQTSSKTSPAAAVQLKGFEIIHHHHHIYFPIITQQKSQK